MTSLTIGFQAAPMAKHAFYMAIAALAMTASTQAADGKNHGATGKRRYDPGPPAINTPECKKQVAKIRKLEFDPRFEIDRRIRLRWQEEVDVGMRMRCEF